MIEGILVASYTTLFISRRHLWSPCGMRRGTSLIPFWVLRCLFQSSETSVFPFLLWVWLCFPALYSKIVNWTFLHCSLNTSELGSINSAIYTLPFIFNRASRPILWLYSTNTHLLNNYDVPGTVSDTEDKLWIGQADDISALRALKGGKQVKTDDSMKMLVKVHYHIIYILPTYFFLL